MIEQPYSYQLRVQGDIEQDRKKFPEPNLHVHGKDDTQIMVYNMEMWPRKDHRKYTQKSLESKLLNSNNFTR